MQGVAGSIGGVVVGIGLNFQGSFGNEVGKFETNRRWAEILWKNNLINLAIAVFCRSRATS
jgi:hypothetical protein